VIAAVWKQISYNFLFFLAGLQSIPRSLIEAASIDGASPMAALLDHRLPAAVAHHLLPAGGQHRLRLLRHLRHDRRHHAGRAGKSTQILVYKVYHDGFKALDLGGSAAQSVILMVMQPALVRHRQDRHLAAVGVCHRLLPLSRAQCSSSG
jgi:sn-glycerol 3-phosphate transport system permease protein